MRMRFIFPLLLVILLISCFGPPTAVNGTLSFQTSINEYLLKTAAVDTGYVQDLRWRFESFEISTGRIIEGAPDTLEWIPVYDDTTESWLSEFGFEAELPLGTYRSLRLAMRNRNWWQCTLEDSLIDVEDWNRPQWMYGPEEASYSYYDVHGCWYNESTHGDTFYNVAPDESISDIEIYNGTMVNITMNWNMYKLVLYTDSLPDTLWIEDWLIREGHDMIEWDISSSTPKEIR